MLATIERLREFYTSNRNIIGDIGKGMRGGRHNNIIFNRSCDIQGIKPFFKADKIYKEIFKADLQA